MGTILQPIHFALLSLGGAAWVMCTQNAFSAPVQGYVMSVQMTPAVCLIDSTKSKKRKCLEGYSLNIEGLYPEVATRECSTHSSAKLPPLQAKVVARVMPDDAARVQLWQGIGGCVPMNASQYFRMIINNADRINVPAVLTGQDTQTVQLGQLRSLFLKSNSGMSSKSIHFQCSNHQGSSYLTEIKICYNSAGRYKQCAANIGSNCPSQFVIKGSY
ncbi:ribonuclease I [Acinetobacter towneri]|uniref:ribonuclease T2 family protein n=1 Tax=Acinetobacter towneri TaxID=202956 RepID=UPI00188A861B|nr:ribonuclease I [Acinetobacter towneri]MBF4519680.1 ribonuclease I [Acinetobacter towneri]